MQVQLFNLGTVNKNEVTLRKDIKDGYEVKLTMTFSYQTCVGFSLYGGGFNTRMVRQNDWSTTTGKLLNELEKDKSKRVTGEDFSIGLSQALKCFEEAQ